jgi:hypothetical protein
VFNVQSSRFKVQRDREVCRLRFVVRSLKFFNREFECMVHSCAVLILDPGSVSQPGTKNTEAITDFHPEL